ncbi:MAG: response regulator, partial [Pseudomonadota bacterium]
MTDAKLVHLVDDDEAIRHSASFMLRHAGFQVRTYPDGVSFLEAAPTAGSGVVLLDVRMPGIDGLAVQNELTRKSIRLPVIILTGHGDILLAVQAMKAGALDFLEKPYEKAALLSALDRAFASLQNAEMISDKASKADARLACLTTRER